MAAITVPVIIANANAEANLEKIKKAYSTLAQAQTRAIADNGPVDNWYEMSDKKAKTYYEMFLKPYLNIMKTCNSSQTCGYKTSRPWKQLNKSVYDWYIGDAETTRYFFYINDGTFVALRTGYCPCKKYDDNGKCIESSIANDSTPLLIVDINGSKEPNTIGKDVFLMQLTEDQGVQPYCYGKNDSQVANSCKKNSDGHCCLKMLMSNGWIYPEKYPK